MRLTVGIGPISVTITINMAINVKILALIQQTLETHDNVQYTRDHQTSVAPEKA